MVDFFSRYLLACCDTDAVCITTSRRRFERVDCLVEMGEWLTGQGLTRGGIDYLASALDLLYDVEEQVRILRGPRTPLNDFPGGV